MKKNKVTAVLGPTNTGKTFLAIETMLSFNSGMIGFPLRLLAREVYDKVINKIDPSKVALITGEEKIIPLNAKYFLCTVESMPIDKDLEFVGIDEISFIFRIVPPSIAGMAKRNENSAAFFGDTPRSIPAVIVTPDLLIPGSIANAWDMPIKVALFALIPFSKSEFSF